MPIRIKHNVGSGACAADAERQKYTPPTDDAWAKMLRDARQARRARWWCEVLDKAQWWMIGFGIGCIVGWLT